MMTAVISCCVFNLFWAESCRVHAFNGISLVTFLFNLYKRFFYSGHVFTLFNVFYIPFWTILHVWLSCGANGRLLHTVFEISSHIDYESIHEAQGKSGRMIS